MRRPVIRFALLLMMAIPQMLHADMSSYCSAPPYVTRSIVPNIMVLMDNSVAMLTAAHPNTYAPTAALNDYMGYFKTTGCYQYSSNKFVEVLNTSVTPNRTYLAGETCPSSAPFRGNLMNWATMSKYDILQKVLIGGNAVSKQGNAHTLLSIGGSWTKDAYSGCRFIVNGGNLTISDVTSGSCSLIASPAAPIALSPLKTFWEMFSQGAQRIYAVVAGGAQDVASVVARTWEEIDLVTRAWAAQLTLDIQSGSLNGTVGIPYSITFEGGGDNNTIYYWSFNPSPPASWLTGPTYSTSGQKNNYRATWSGTPTAADSHTFTVTLTDRDNNTPVTTEYILTITTAPLIINTPSLPAGEVGIAYPAVTMTGQGGSPSYTWSATGLPDGLSIDATTGVISGTPTTAGTYTIVVTLTDSTGATVSKTFSNIQIAAATGVNSVNYSVKVELIEEPFTDLNGNGIWDLGETYTDSNGDGSWQGKQGIFQKFWDANNPRARWGLTKFGQTGGTTTVEVEACIPASPASSFYTRIQNAQPVAGSPLAKGVYGDINYYGFLSPYGTGYNGCSGADPIDNVPCRKNFLLILSSGHDVSGTAYSTTACNQTDPLVRNACYGYTTDLRPELDNSSPPKEIKPGKQKMYTYVVNTMGTTNNAILQAAALAGGGKYYDASDSATLQQQLTNALTDILAQAASGTAVSVLTTSSRGIGSMVQAYFLPVKQEGTREVLWTGYTQNLWIDPQDNLREDTPPSLGSPNDFQLKLAEDKVIKLYFDTTTNETKVATFTTLADGSGGDLAACQVTENKAFSQINYLWEAGKKLALKAPDSRNIITAKHVFKGLTETHTFTTAGANNFDTGNAGAFSAALDFDATYTAANIIRYVRGECLETGVIDDIACGATASSTYRDRRITVTGGGANGNVWKLGDVISSTPKVFANTPANSYHIDYGDGTYRSYVSGPNYKTRSSLAFVGANDGMLHAFRVGYLKDTGLTAPVKALFKNLFTSSDTGATGEIGQEVWAYVPFNAFPYLKYLANPAYCHLYFNDLSVRLVDASIGGAADAAKTGPTYSGNTLTAAGSWRSILIGGMRFGGGCAGGTPAPPASVSNVGYSAYYAIDVTDPNPANWVPLWEFSDDDMGYSTTFPSIIRTGPSDENGNWYVAIGSGSTTMPKSNTDIARTTPGYIYLLDLKTGEMVKKIGLDHNAIVGDILAIDGDRDYYSEKLYFGTAHKPGTSWAGKLMSLAIPTDITGLCGSGVTKVNASNTDCGSSVLKTLFNGSYPFTASPDAARDTSGNVWVYAGSGKYYSDVDEADPAAQVFMGVMDKSSITYPLTIADITDRTDDETEGTVTGTTTACLYNGTSFGMRTLVTSIQQTGTIVTAPPKGWYVTLSASERVITRPLAVGGLVDFLTYKPSSEACSYGGDSYLYALGYTTGVAPSTVAIRAPETTGGVTTGSVTVAKGVLLGPGAPPTGEAIIIPPPKEGQETLKKKIQIATGVIVEAENAPVLSVVSKIVHWLKK